LIRRRPPPAPLATRFTKDEAGIGQDARVMRDRGLALDDPAGLSAEQVRPIVEEIDRRVSELLVELTLEERGPPA
jgi:hypothetical protein